ncbi:MAG: TolC family protein [Candidatus Gastranaerophilales bacterium]|nr:TolC family protein [Candidatus Gastranaerophilales bacterium]
MREKLKLYIIFVIIIFATLGASAEEYTYKDTLKFAIDNSFELKMSIFDIEISKTQLKSVRADWYPSLSLQFNSEYNKDLDDGYGTYAYAGNTMITPYTQYRDMLYFTVSYNLLDFGIQGKKVHIAKQELAQKEISYNLKLKELKLKILDLYTKDQQYNYSINSKTAILALYENMFKNKERLFKAGMNNKLSVMDEAIKIAKTQNEIDEARIELKNILEDLKYHTNIDYKLTNLFFRNINENSDELAIVPVNSFESNNTEASKTNNILTFNPDETYESKYYDLEIDKKKSELSILKRQLLPSFRIYAGYSLYGQDPHNYYSSMQDIEQRSFVVGISSQYTLFDGFKNKANRKKTKLEIEKLKIEKENKLNELNRDYQKSYKSYETYQDELNINKNLLLSVKEKLEAVNRLKANKLAEQNDLLSTKAELLNQEYECEKNIINITSKLEELKIMSGVDIGL